MKNRMILEEARNELLLYTLEHAKNDASFIHQYVVDAWAAQHADSASKKIGVAFSLIGLYLHLEKNYTGKEVQLAHVRLEKNRKEWPIFELPERRGDVTVFDVLNAATGNARDAMIEKWCMSVWEAWGDSHAKVAKLAQDELGLD